MDIANKIVAKKERAIQIKDRLTELKAMAEADDAADLTAEEIEEIDTLSDEMEAVGKSVAALEKIELTIAAKALPAKPDFRAPADPVRKEKGGSLLIKLATAKLMAHVNKSPLAEVIGKVYGSDDRVAAVADFYAKTAVAPATTTEAGWAAELVEDDLQGFLEDLQPVSVYANLRAQGIGLNFGGYNSITIPRRAVGGANNDLSGSWVGEGGVIPVKRLTLGSQTLNRYKAAVISTFTEEILQQSTPSIEGIVRGAIMDDTAIALDGALLDSSNVVAGVRPPGLLFGVTPTASAGDTAADIITDMKVLFSAMTAANLGARPVLIMHPDRILGLATVSIASGEFIFKNEINNGTLMGAPVISSANVAADEVHMVDASSFAAANDTPMFNVSDQATLTMANADATAPTQAGDGAGALGTAEQVLPGEGINVHEAATTANAGYEAVSMYQTYSQAIRMVLPTSWGLIRADAVASLSGVSW